MSTVEHPEIASRKARVAETLQSGRGSDPYPKLDYPKT